jgi:ribosomal-protein-alanine N-acetyltransferase
VSTPKAEAGKPDRKEVPEGLDILVVHEEEELPDWAPRTAVSRFFHEGMKPYEDRLEDVERGLDYAFSDAEGKGGFLVIGRYDGKLASALLMLNTGMGGYVPENILLFVGTLPELRGKGIGRAICEKAIDSCEGAVKLHVEYDNPAKRLYERIGFVSKYAEMRLER